MKETLTERRTRQANDAIRDYIKVKAERDELQRQLEALSVQLEAAGMIVPPGVKRALACCADAAMNADHLLQTCIKWVDAQ